jgi:glycine hydroxymethyltransferase
MTAVGNRAYAPNSSFFSGSLAETDPDLSAAVQDELKRQQEKIELIASENIVSRAVLDSSGLSPDQ